jgi:hypothetical protein
VGLAWYLAQPGHAKLFWWRMTNAVYENTGTTKAHHGVLFEKPPRNCHALLRAGGRRNTQQQTSSRRV